jgi:hypothetical protein
MSKSNLSAGRRFCTARRAARRPSKARCQRIRCLRKSPCPGPPRCHPAARSATSQPTKGTGLRRTALGALTAATAALALSAAPHPEHFLSGADPVICPRPPICLRRSSWPSALSRVAAGALGRRVPGGLGGGPMRATAVTLQPRSRLAAMPQGVLPGLVVRLVGSEAALHGEALVLRHGALLNLGRDGVPAVHRIDQFAAQCYQASIKVPLSSHTITLRHIRRMSAAKRWITRSANLDRSAHLPQPNLRLKPTGCCGTASLCAAVWLLIRQIRVRAREM